MTAGGEDEVLVGVQALVGVQVLRIGTNGVVLLVLLVLQVGIVAPLRKSQSALRIVVIN